MTRALAVALGLALSLCAAAPSWAQTASTEAQREVEVGRRLYQEGVRADGSALRATRRGDAALSGALAACVHCHRPSGMGQVEADMQVPPISGPFLFPGPGEKPRATMDPHVGKMFNQAHDAYTDASLGVALRQGVNNLGRQMNVVMPQYTLEEHEIRALSAYLGQLSAHLSPGATHDSIRFAMVITPDVDAVRRRVLIDMARAIVRQKNSSTVTAKQGNARRHMTSAAEMILGTERRWELDIWELQGASQTWGEQLAQRYRSQPVFALVSGASLSTWRPVHDFCDRERVPCWFPSVPQVDEAVSPYAFYFSRGVVLEAQALARHLRDQPRGARKLVQVYRDDESGRAAAQALTRALAGSGIALVNRALPTGLAGAEALRAALAAPSAGAAWMLWLRAPDIEALEQFQPVAGKSYFSGVLAQGEHAPLPAAWRTRASMVYPYELPQQRVKNLEYFHAWLAIRNIPLVDEAMQSEAFFAWSFMTDSLVEMLNNVYRDYLTERAETMLSQREGAKSEQETRDRLALGRPADLRNRHGAMTTDAATRVQLVHPGDRDAVSHGTTIYRRLDLGPGQRLASKSAYIVRFARDSGTELIAESPLIVP